MMADPGCHWFSADGKKYAGLAVRGKTTFRNRDEATLVFKGNGLSAKLPVGKTLASSKRGTYRITMVGQAPDDNHLLLVIR